MTLIFDITRVSDGLKRTYTMRDVGGSEYTAYWFREGNMACDCNRALDFARAGCEPDDFEPDCGDGAFQVGPVTDEHGKCWYEGDELHRAHGAKREA